MSADSDEEDIWEEVVQSTQTPDEQPEQADAEDGNISFTIELKKKTKKRRGITKQDREDRANLHRAHLLLLSVMNIRLNGALDNSFLQSILLSHIPLAIQHDLLEFGKEIESAKKPKIAVKKKPARVTRKRRIVKDDNESESDTAERDSDFETPIGKRAAKSSISTSSDLDRINRLIVWWNDTFEVLISNSNQSPKLLVAARSLSGTQEEKSLLFVALCRALGLPTRLVCALKPLSLQLKMAELSPNVDKTSQNSSNGASPPSSIIDVKIPESLKRKQSRGDSAPDAKSCTYWTEIYSASMKKWVFVNVLNPDTLDKPEDEFGETLQAAKLFVYITSIDPQSRRVKDITCKYTSDMTSTKLRKARDDIWWSDLLDKVLVGAIYDTEAEHVDNELIASRVQTNVMPKSIAGFHNHPNFVLERHLKKYECLHPKTSDLVVGQIRGEDIYPRSIVKTLHTADKWLSLEGRIVKKGERPLKTVKSRSMNSAIRDKKRIKSLRAEEDDSDMDENGGGINGIGPDNTVGLFGEWQTEVFHPSPIVNGIIPKNKYNNMDLFKPSMLPPGAVHLTEDLILEDLEGGDSNLAQIRQNMRLPTLKKILKSMENIDYAEAVTGFEYHGGYSVPRVEGVVIAAEYEQIVRTEYVKQILAAVDKARREQEKRIIQRWERLVRKALNYCRLKKKFAS